MKSYMMWEVRLPVKDSPFSAKRKCHFNIKNCQKYAERKVVEKSKKYEIDGIWL